MMYSTDDSFTYYYDNSGDCYNGIRCGLYYNYTGYAIGYLNSLRKKFGLIFCLLRSIDTPLDVNSVSYFDPRKNREVIKQNNEKYAQVTYYRYNEKENIIQMMSSNSSGDQYIKFKTFKKNFKLYGREIDTNSLDFKREIRRLKIKSLDI